MDPLSRPGASRSARFITNTLLLLAGIAPALLMFHFMTALWVPLPLWDEWTTPGEMFASWWKGTLTLRELLSQHNESRKFFPRLLYLGLAQLDHWDVRNLMLLTFASVGGLVALFYRLLRTMPDATTTTALVPWVAASFLCFSGVQLDNFLWGIQVETFYPGIAVVAMALINLSRLSLGSKAFLNGALALIATYTAAHGMLLWALGVPLLGAGESWRQRRNALSYVGYFLCASLAIGTYFIGYHRPSYHPPFFAQHPVGDFTRYLLLWVGSYFASPHANPLAVGAAAVVVFAAALIAAVAVVRQHRNWRSFYGAILIALYTAMTAVVTAAGRIGFGVEQALERRYRTFSLFFFLALIAFLSGLYCSWFRAATVARRRLFLTSCSLLGVVSLVGWIASYGPEVKHSTMMSKRNIILCRALEWMEVVPDNPDLVLIFPARNWLLERARIVRDHHWTPLRWVNDEIARKVRTAPTLQAEDPFCRMETCVFNPEHRLWLTGLAWLPERKRRADCIVIGCIDAAGVWKPLSVLNTGIHREGLTGSKRRAGFARTIETDNVPPGDVTIAAWAVDLRNKVVHPIAGAKFFPAHLR